MKKKFDNPVSFWYPIRNVGQLTFDQKTVVVSIPQEGHILYQGRLMCKQSMERLKAEAGAKNQKTVSTRIQGISICSNCQEEFKKNPNLDWAHWVSPPELKNPATIKINPELLRGTDDEK